MRSALDWPWLALLLFLLGLSATTFFSAIGLSGGALVSPILILVFGLEPRIAVGTTIVGVFTAVLSASIAYLWQKRVDVKLALLFDALDLVGVVLGAYLTTVLRPEFLATALGAFLIFSGTKIMAKAVHGLRCRAGSCEAGSMQKPMMVGRGSGSRYRLDARKLVIAVSGSLFSGLTSGMLGLGGGLVDISLMLLIGIPMEIAVPTAMFGMLITRCGSVIAHVIIGNVRAKLAAPLAVGAFVGGQIGPRIFRKARPEHLQLAFSCIVLSLGVMLLLENVAKFLAE